MKITNLLLYFGIAFAAWGIILLFMSWNLKPDIDTFPRLLMLLILPLGSALFLYNDDENEGLSMVVRIVGLAVMVIPSFVLHIQIMSGAIAAHSVYLSIFPLVCLGSTITYIAVGYDTLGYVGKAGLFLAAVALSFLNWLLYVLIGASATGLCVFYLIVGIISLIILGITRLSFGSAFEY